MSAGQLQQIAPPAELYERPRTAFVAEFVGLTNRLPATAADGRARVIDTEVPLLDGSVGTGPVTVLVRPESLLVSPDPDGNAHVLAPTYLGSLCRVQVRLDDGTEALAQVATADAPDLGPGTRVRVGVRPAPVLALPRS
jgi:putative spermidine/putrescine transport system ATP-binding protein